MARRPVITYDPLVEARTSFPCWEFVFTDLRGRAVEIFHPEVKLFIGDAFAYEKDPDLFMAHVVEHLKHHMGHEGGITEKEESEANDVARFLLGRVTLPV